jgi:hypothetical protein
MPSRVLTCRAACSRVLVTDIALYDDRDYRRELSLAGQPEEPPMAPNDRASQPCSFGADRVVRRSPPPPSSLTMPRSKKPKELLLGKDGGTPPDPRSQPDLKAGETHIDIAEVIGSIPIAPTTPRPEQSDRALIAAHECARRACLVNRLVSTDAAATLLASGRPLVGRNHQGVPRARHHLSHVDLA